jgi:hypothetical protein
MKPFKTVIAPKGIKIASYLTEGKEYEVINIIDENDNPLITIIDDSNEKLHSFLKHTAHLNNQDWIIKPEPETNKAKEEAWNMVNTFLAVKDSTLKIQLMDLLEAKECALIACEYLIKEQTMWQNGQPKPVLFWQEVKEEIENLI